MAEFLRNIGDLAPSELAGPMAGFVADLGRSGRAVTINLPGTSEPDRWVLDEDQPLYEVAFGLGSTPHAPGGRPTPLDPPLARGDTGGSVRPGRRDRPGVKAKVESAVGSVATDEALATIVRRYLRNHALVGAADLLARYPIASSVATDLLERFADEGNLVRLDPAEGESDPRWAERGNLDEVRRLSVAIRRRESVAVAPEAFADFVARLQGVHPSTRREGVHAVALAVERLQGFAAPVDLWESEILPRRVTNYRPEWLDEALGATGSAWRAAGDGGKAGDLRVAFVPRDFAGPWPEPNEPVELDPNQRKVLDHLTARGASFVAEVAAATGLGPTATRSALLGLIRAGLATNDRFDPLRPGASDAIEALVPVAERVGTRPRFGRHRPSFGRSSSPAGRPEGRWSPHPPGPLADEGAEANYLAWAALLMDRYGVLCRETATLDPWAPPWRDLAPWLARAEMRGEIRRGYFVEGLSGVQYATAETAEALAKAAGLPGVDRRDEPFLLPTLDPANLYGSGAPLDVPLLEGGTARLPRNAGNYLVPVAGRPVLIVESFGKRLTGLASASEAELRAALALLPSLAGPSRRVLKVEAYNTAAPLASPAAPWLAEVGFVRDFPGMAYYYTGW